MPQLDIVTFLSQFFWLCFFFIGFYYIIYKYFLPQYSRCILFRDKYSHSSIVGSSANIEEKENIEASLSLYTTSGVGKAHILFQESKNNTGNWHVSLHKKMAENDWKAANLLYIQTFGAKQASNLLCKNCISYMVGSSIYIAKLSKICLFYGENVKPISSRLYVSSSSSGASEKGSAHVSVDKKPKPVTKKGDSANIKQSKKKFK